MSHIERYFERERDILSCINIEEVARLCDAIQEVTRKGKRVFIAGNGGSASTADHFAVDLSIGTYIRVPSAAVSAISLSSNNAAITALSNDTSYELVFSKQFEVLNPTPGDLVIVISASGDSPNIIGLLETAKERRVLTCALTGFNGGKAKNLADISVHVPTELGEYGIVEDLHLAICHALTESLRRGTN